MGGLTAVVRALGFAGTDVTIPEIQFQITPTAPFPGTALPAAAIGCRLYDAGPVTGTAWKQQNQ